MNVILEEYISEYIIEKSKFISLISPINSLEDVKNYLKEIKNRYPKATHYCYAYCLDGMYHSSDDGEPSGTAGVPILKVLESSKISNSILVVVRYFGGIKLGAGGLLRAYTHSASQVTKAIAIHSKNTCSCYKTSISYSIEQTFIKALEKFKGKILEKNYDENVEVSFYIANKKDLDELNTLFLGQLVFEYIGEKEVIV